MSAKRNSESEAPASRGLSKKDQILSLFAGGITEVDDLAMITQSRPTYVAGVLQDNHLMTGYFDLYTTTKNPMNVYSKFFAGKLGFKDEEAARKSVELLDHYYRQFEIAEDRAGQHHCLVLGLTMFDRARWTGKGPEAEVFRQWLDRQLQEARPAAPEPTATEAAKPLPPRKASRK